ncbi:MAG: hypothetical protein WCC04_20550 [Terriglobales bacterium]
MIWECLSVICMLGIVILGMLIMTRTVTLGQVAETVGRLFTLVLGVLITLCLLRALVIAVVAPWLLSLKAAVGWLAIVLLAIIALALIVQKTASK